MLQIFSLHRFDICALLCFFFLQNVNIEGNVKQFNAESSSEQNRHLLKHKSR